MEEGCDAVPCVLGLSRTVDIKDGGRDGISLLKGWNNVGREPGKKGKLVKP
jgi:hypothetical protein